MDLARQGPDLLRQLGDPQLEVRRSLRVHPIDDRVMSWTVRHFASPNAYSAPTASAKHAQEPALYVIVSQYDRRLAPVAQRKSVGLRR